ncbi:FCD domain-containing protein [Phytohalomonas tamaricis]|nr:FCD domain-containing protein [Phytohalomonas tamaricis]
MTDKEPGAIKRSYRKHVHIVEALQRGDPDAAERAMLLISVRLSHN